MYVSNVSDVSSVYQASYVNKSQSRTANAQKSESNHDSTQISEEAKLRGNYMIEFIRCGAMKSRSLSENIQTSSQKYAELLEDINNKYADNEDERLKQTDALNQALEGTLKSAAYSPIFRAEQESIRAGQHPLFQKHMALLYPENNASMDLYKTNQTVLQRFGDSMRNIATSFYNDFIGSIGTDGYENAFASSFNNMENKETTSFDNISYRDMLSVLSAISGNGKDLYNAHQSIAQDENINGIIRQKLADIYDFQINFNSN